MGCAMNAPTREVTWDREVWRTESLISVSIYSESKSISGQTLFIPSVPVLGKTFYF
jgi:hypothetical protein